jgi:Fe-S oxidoreductase/nitrate reductase gamma subunit
LLTAFDILLIGFAFTIMSVGLAKRWSLWRSKLEKDGSNHRRGDWIGLIGYLFGHARILKRNTIGAFHLLVFWGFVIPLIVIILAQFGFVMPEELVWSVSIAEDILGIALLAGASFFLVKRLKLSDSEGPKRTILPAIVILVIVLTGFFSEGIRLSITQTGFSWPSPIGGILSFAMPASPKFMQLMIRCHFLAVLLFIAILPFTFMRHVAAAALNVVYRKTTDRGQLTHLDLNGETFGVKTVADLNWKQLLDAEACVSCGRCEENCPAAITGKPLSPRKVIRNILEQLEVMNKYNPASDQIPAPLLEEAITEYEIWECTTCMACVEHCPLFIEPMDKIIDLRRHQVMVCGRLPSEAEPLIRNLELSGDAMGKGASHRTDWTLDLQIPHISCPDLNPEILFWPGCSGSFHKDYQEISRKMVKILRAADVRFGILGKEESCCGDPARRLGEERLFQTLAKKNISRINSYPVTKIVTLCPHCLNTLKNEYPDLGGDFDVVHATEFVMELIAKGKIIPKYPVKQKMTVHDPCYLGRMNQVYQPLRDVCEAVPGIELTEMAQNRDKSFCCGGGGGRMWLNQGFGLGMNLIRSEHVVESGVELVGTACPHCLIMLDEGLRSLGMESPPKVADIMDIVASSIV